MTRQQNASNSTRSRMVDTVAGLSQLFKTLSDQKRLRIVLRLSNEGEQTVTELCRFFRLPQPLVSHHLARLRSAGILRARRDGRQVYYTVRRERFQQLMGLLAGRQARELPCERFLECVIG